MVFVVVVFVSVFVFVFVNLIQARVISEKGSKGDAPKWRRPQEQSFPLLSHLSPSSSPEASKGTVIAAPGVSGILGEW